MTERRPLSDRLRYRVSRLAGWAADRRVPGPLRGLLYRGYGLVTGAALSEMRGKPRDYASLGSFFVRRLADGARTVEPDRSLLPSPVDGMIQALSRVEAGGVVEAKERRYEVRELLAGVGADVDLEGGWCWTLYLGPKDYHRIHAPEAGRLVEARHVDGMRFSVQPRVLAKRKVLPVNERVALRLETERGPLLLVFVGAVVVGRIRVVGLAPLHRGPVEPPRELARGEELGRFEMGSTVVMIAPPDRLQPLERPATGDSVKLGQALARYLPEA